MRGLGPLARRGSRALPRPRLRVGSVTPLPSPLRGERGRARSAPDLRHGYTSLFSFTEGEGKKTKTSPSPLAVEKTLKGLILPATPYVKGTSPCELTVDFLGTACGKVARPVENPLTHFASGAIASPEQTLTPQHPDRSPAIRLRPRSNGLERSGSRQPTPGRRRSLMILQLQAPIARISGAMGKPSGQNAVGGIVAMPDKNGRTLAREYVVPTQPNTSPQQLAKSRVSAIVEAYQSLSLSQVEAWEDAAQTIVNTGRLGQAVTMNWTQLFMQVNNYRLQDGQGIVEDPPALTAAPIVTQVDALLSDDGSPDQVLTLSFLTASASPSGFWAIRYTRPLGSPVRQARATDFRYVNTPANCLVARTDSTSQTVLITSTLINIVPDDNVGIEIKALNAGYVPTSVFRVGNQIVATP